MGIRFSWGRTVKSEVSDTLLNTVWRKQTLNEVTCLLWPFRLFWSLKCQNSLFMKCSFLKVLVSRDWRTTSTNTMWSMSPKLTTDAHNMTLTLNEQIFPHIPLCYWPLLGFVPSHVPIERHKEPGCLHFLLQLSPDLLHHISLRTSCFFFLKKKFVLENKVKMTQWCLEVEPSGDDWNW